MSPPPPKIFLDTNVWFSAFYGSENAEKLIRAHIEGKIKATVSQQVLEELVKNIKKKIPQAIDAFRRLLESTPPQIVRSPEKTAREVKRWVAAVNAKVKFFVTGNTKDFSVKNLKKRFSIEILSPRQATKKLGL